MGVNVTYLLVLLKLNVQNQENCIHLDQFYKLQITELSISTPIKISRTFINILRIRNKLPRNISVSKPSFVNIKTFISRLIQRFLSCRQNASNWRAVKCYMFPHMRCDTKQAQIQTLREVLYCLNIISVLNNLP